MGQCRIARSHGAGGALHHYMNSISRFIHNIRGWRYVRIASRLQCDLTEHVLTEETRIAICLHRAIWHLAQSRPDTSTHHKKNVTNHHPSAKTNGHSHPTMENTTKNLVRIIDRDSRDASIGKIVSEPSFDRSDLQNTR
jgi:hypothetical protein